MFELWKCTVNRPTDVAPHDPLPSQSVPGSDRGVFCLLKIYTFTLRADVASSITSLPPFWFCPLSHPDPSWVFYERRCWTVGAVSTSVDDKKRVHRRAADLLLTEATV